MTPPSTGMAAPVMMAFVLTGAGPPTVRWREQTTRFFRGGDPAQLLAECADEVRLAAG